MNEHITRVFRNVRDENGLTQAQHAEMLGVSAGHIGTIEQGRTKPSYELMAKVVLRFDVDANGFFGREREPISADAAKSLLIMQNEAQSSFDQYLSSINEILHRYENTTGENE